MKNAIQRLNDKILEKNSRICAGLDPVWDNIPECLKKEVYEVYQKYEETINYVPKNVTDDVELTNNVRKAIFRTYCMRYIDAICDIVPAIKINIAFFEKEGLGNMYFQIADYAKGKDLFVIGDVKRADIGSTSKAYAEAFLSVSSPFDAITINPYFGTDGVMPFLELAKENGKGVFVLVKTSNKSSCEIQDLNLEDGRHVYEAVADWVVEWGRKVDIEDYSSFGTYPHYPMIGAVVGATHPKQALEIGARMGEIFFLVPGYGAQGATANDVAVNFDLSGLGAIVNSSRSIMNAYKSEKWKDEYSEETWAEAARAEAECATNEINNAINQYFEEEIC